MDIQHYIHRISESLISCRSTSTKTTLIITRYLSYVRFKVLNNQLCVYFASYSQKRISTATLMWSVFSKHLSHRLYRHEDFPCTLCFRVGRDSSVGIVTRYGLDSPGIESRWRRDFPHLSRPALGPTQPPIQWVPGLSRG